MMVILLLMSWMFCGVFMMGRLEYGWSLVDLLGMERCGGDFLVNVFNIV